MQFDLEFVNPFSIKISVEDIAEHDNSFGGTLELKIEMNGAVFMYKCKDVWFDYHMFDSFNSALKLFLKGEQTTPEFFDFDREVFIKFVDDEIKLTIYKPSIEGSANIEFEYPIDNDIVSSYIKHLEDFPRWW